MATFQRLLRLSIRRRPLILVPLLLSFVAISAASDVVKSFSCEGKPNGDYADPLEECSKNYVSCTNGNAVLRQCPEGLHYDPTKGVCDWKQNIVECKQERLTFVCSADGNFAQSTGACGRLYWQCTGGQPRSLSCDGNEIFDQQSKQCIRASGMCAFCSARPRGRYPLRDGCHDEYYECAEDYGPTAIEKCAKPYVFSAVTQLCAPQHDVAECRPQSQQREVTHVSDVLLTPPPTHMQISQAAPSQLNAPPTDNRCTKPSYVAQCSPLYDACYDGRFVRRRCPDALVYYEPYGGCVARWQSPECSISSEMYTSRCRSKPNTKVSRGRCNAEYVHCMGTIPLRQWCAPNQVFDESIQSCVDIDQRPVCLAGERTTPAAAAAALFSDRHRSTPMVSCSDHQRRAKARKAIQRCSNLFVQCHSSNGDETHSCVPETLIYDELFDRCVPPELSNECSTDTSKAFYPLQRRRRYASQAMPFFNPPLFGTNQQQPQQQFQQMPPPYEPFRATEFDVSKNIHLRMEVDHQMSRVEDDSPAAIIADLDGLNFDGGPAKASAILAPPASNEVARFVNLQPAYGAQAQQRLVGDVAAPDDFCAGRSDGVYGVGHCRRDYAVCRDKRELRLSCPDGQVFDANSMRCMRDERCDAPRNLHSHNNWRNASSTLELMRLVCLNKPNGVYAIAACSRFYYTCFNGQYRLLQCKFGETFDMTERRCTEAQRDCATSAPVANFAGTNMPQFCEGSFETWTACADSCAERTCDDQPAQQRCAKKTTTCSPGCVCRPGYVRLTSQSRICVPEEACLQYSLTKNSLQRTFCNNRPDGVYPYPGKTCTNEYLRCSAGSMVDAHCPAGQLFDAAKAACVSQMACAAPGPPNVPGGGGGLDSYFCRGKPTGAYNLPGKTCFNLYYTCADGVVTFGKCPPGEVFDLHTGCVPPSLCDDGPVDPEDLYCAGRPDGDYPFNNYQCFPVYFQCKRGRVVFAICHALNEDLVFNGKGCVPRDVCQTTQGTSTALPVRYKSPFNDSHSFDPTFCNNQPDGAYPIVECTSPYLVCINSVTTIHYCFPGEVFARVNLPSGVVYQCAQPKYTLCEPVYASTQTPPTNGGTTTDGAPVVGNTLCNTRAADGNLYPLSNDPCERHYINCTNRNFVLQSCAGKLVFNVTSKTCDPDLSCLSQPPPDYRQLCADKASGFYTFTLCSQYYLYCQKGVGWVQSCLNPTWAFNGHTLQCAPRNQVVGCQEGATIATITQRDYERAMPKPGDLSALDARCQTLGDGGYEISACQSDYIVCNMGFGDVRSCAKGTVFSAQAQRCVATSQVTACNLQTGDSLCRAKVAGAYSFGPCQQQFYICWMQFSYVQRCQENQIFHVRLQACVNVNSVPACLAGHKEPVVPCTSVGRWASGACRSSFNLCIPEGRLVTVHCGEGELFDRRREMCVRADMCETSAHVGSAWPPARSAVGQRPTNVIYNANLENAKKPAKLQPFNVLPASWSAAATTANQGSAASSLMVNHEHRNAMISRTTLDTFCADKADGFYRHPWDCTKFMQCFRRRTFSLNCATGLVFNPKLNVCDFARNVVDCNLIARNEWHPAGDQLRAKWLCAGAEHGQFVRDPTDCRRYFRCVHDKAYKFDCPPTLVFNVRLNVCDYPSNVPECPVIEAN